MHLMLWWSNLLVLLLFSVSSVYAQNKDVVHAPISSKQLVVMIDGRFPTTGKLTQGAGIVVGRRGGLVYIVTAGHVVSGLTEAAVDIKIQFQDRPGEEVDATLWPSNLDKGIDVAVLVVSEDRVPASITSLDEFSTARIAQEVKVGEGAYLFGQPSGRVWSGNKSPEEIVSSTSTTIEVESNTVAPGMSGGATFDDSLRIIGLIVESERGIARIIPLKLLKETLEGAGYPFALVDVTIASSIEAENENRINLAKAQIKKSGFSLDAVGLRNSLYSGANLIKEFSEIGVDFSSDQFLEDIIYASSDDDIINYLSILGSFTSEDIREASSIAADTSTAMHLVYSQPKSIMNLCDSSTPPTIPTYICRTNPGYDFAITLAEYINYLYAFSGSDERVKWDADFPKEHIIALVEDGKIDYISEVANDTFVKNTDNNKKTFSTNLKFWINHGVRPIQTDKDYDYNKSNSYDNRLSYDLYMQYCLYDNLIRKHWNLRYCEMDATVFIDGGVLSVVDQLVSDDEFRDSNAPHWDSVYLSDSNRAMATGASVDKRLEVWVVCGRGDRKPYVALKSSRLEAKLGFPGIISGDYIDVVFSNNKGYRDLRRFGQTNISYIYTGGLDRRFLQAISGNATEMSIELNGEKFRIKLTGSTKAISETLSRHSCRV